MSTGRRPFVYDGLDHFVFDGLGAFVFDGLGPFVFGGIVADELGDPLLQLTGALYFFRHPRWVRVPSSGRNQRKITNLTGFMKQLAQREYWLRGPVPGFPPLLQPVVHALLQARDEVNALMEGFPDEKLWERPAGVASVGFHLRHLTGVLDRLLTYARGEGLSGEQLAYLKGEGLPVEEGSPDGEGLPVEEGLADGEGLPDEEGLPVEEGLADGEGLPERGGSPERDGSPDGEGLPVGEGGGPVGGYVAKDLVERFNIQVDKALGQIKGVLEEDLRARRDVGRDRIPSTVGGLIFHAAEHTQRHVGQLLVTARVVAPAAGSEKSPL